MNHEIKLMAHTLPDFPDAYLMRLQSDGKLLAIGRNPLRAAAERAVEEGLAHTATLLTVVFVNGSPSLSATVAEALSKPKQAA